VKADLCANIECLVLLVSRQ